MPASASPSPQPAGHGILPQSQLSDAIAKGYISATPPIDAQQMQPASIDA